MNLQKIRFLVFSIVLYILPVSLIWSGVISFDYRFHVLILAFISAVLYSVIQKYSLSDLGFKPKELVRSLQINSIVSLLALLGLGLFYIFGFVNQLYFPDWSLFYIFYIFLSAPIQTFLYRSLLFLEMKNSNIVSNSTQIAIATIYYTFLHVIYLDWATLLITASIGMFWAFLYSKYKDFWGIAISHSVLGAFTIFLGII
jgi:membrane protease YdiL (CAAX protease family)